LLLLVVAGLVVAYGRKGTDQTEPVTSDAKLVETETAKLDHVSRLYTLVNQSKNQLRAPTGGTVLAKLSSVGQIVDTGTPVYRIGQVNRLKTILPPLNHFKP
jgi:biotin carboxyl carrier protein